VIGLPLTKAFWFAWITYGKTFSKRLANTLDIIFASKLISEIGANFWSIFYLSPFFQLALL